MKNTHIRFIISVLFTFSFSYCFSQDSNDTLKTILASKSFTLEEAYMGDWGGYLQTFSFKIDGNNVRLKCKYTESAEKYKELDTLLSFSALKKLDKVFSDCSAKIKTEKNKSTEHIIYKFKNDTLTFIIDDRFTMACNENFKAWKKLLFQN